MAKKTSIYLKEWISLLLKENNRTFSNETLDYVMEKAFLPTKWGLDFSFKAYYSGVKDIRILLADICSIVSFPDYYNGMRLTPNEELHVLQLLSDFIRRNDWEKEWEPKISGDYDPKNYRVWLSGLAYCYEVAQREISFYNNLQKLKQKLNDNQVRYTSQSGFHLYEGDLKLVDYYKEMEIYVKDLLQQHLSPARYLDIIIESWEFYRRFKKRMRTELEFIFLCSSSPVYSSEMVKDLREYLKRLSDKYTFLELNNGIHDPTE